MKSIYREEAWLPLQEYKEEGKAFKYIYDDGNYKIEYPFIKRTAGKINNITYYDIVTARGESGIYIESKKKNYDMQTKQKSIENFENEFNEFCKKNNIIAEYVRFEPWEDVSKLFSKTYNIQYHGNLFCVPLKEDFYKTQFDSNKRREIRIASESNLKIEWDFKGKCIKDFIKLYNYTETKYNVSNYYLLDEEFIKLYFKYLKDKCFFINAYYNNELISSCMMLLGQDIMHYHFSANNPEHKKLQANTYLLYKSMIYAKEKGKELFDLGGATKDSPLERYKKQFTRTGIYPYNIGTKIRNEVIYDQLVKNIGGPRKGYFPEYRQ